MEVDNQTNEPVEYDQSGSGTDDKEGRCQGMLPPRGTPGSSRAFPPCGPKPWTVTFKDAQGKKKCVSPEIEHPNAKVQLMNLNGCRVEVDEPTD